MTIAAVTDFREAARRRLPRFLFDYLDGGSFAEVTLARNVDDLRAIALRQRVLRQVASIDLRTELFGQKLAMPVMLAPVGLAGLYARRGECQAVRAAEAAGIAFTLSTVSACPIEEVARAASRPFWFQLYMLKDRGFMREMLARARAARCAALVFTVDLPVSGVRYRDFRSGLSGMSGWKGKLWRGFQIAARPRWTWDVGARGGPHTLGNVATALGGGGMQDFMGWLSANFDPAIDWSDLDFIRTEWDGPLIIKGVLDPDDAREAAALGADGIVVSNHGGRQLDGVLSTARALPRIAEAVGDCMTVLADGGVRSGLDVVRMLALGAQGVLLGRAWVYAMGAGGQRGIARMLDIIRQEMTIAMTLTGVRAISEIDRSILEPAEAAAPPSP